MSKYSLRDFWAPLFLFALFFIIQVSSKPSEIALTLVALSICGLIFALRVHKNEPKVFLLGLVLGLFVEVFLGLFARQQHWEGASLMGVPIWLPIIWGIGFVVITRIGAKIEGLK